MLARVLQAQAHQELRKIECQRMDVEKGNDKGNGLFEASQHEPSRCQILNGTEIWMSRIDDRTLMSALTLPGTHDSATYTMPWPFVQTQTMDVTTQLDAGIRYLDLRCGLRNDILEMVHGPTILGIKLDELLKAVYEWLATHLSEGIVVQIKQDRKAEKSSLPFGNAIRNCVAQSPERWRTSNTTPTVRELRGKLQLFRRFDGRNLDAYGIDVTRWQDNPLTPFTIETENNVRITIQDHYDFREPVSLSILILTKTSDVFKMLSLAANSPDPGHWFINFTSASELNWWHQIPPREVAVGGISDLKWEEGINPRLRSYPKNYPGVHRYGIVPMDFPEIGADDLIAALIKSNFASESKWREILPYVLFLALLVLVMILCILTRTWPLDCL